MVLSPWKIEKNGMDRMDENNHWGHFCQSGTIKWCAAPDTVRLRNGSDKAVLKTGGNKKNGSRSAAPGSLWRKTDNKEPISARQS
jgi:hypothetical protein